MGVGTALDCAVDTRVPGISGEIKLPELVAIGNQSLEALRRVLREHHPKSEHSRCLPVSRVNSSPGFGHRRHRNWGGSFDLAHGFGGLLDLFGRACRLLKILRDWRHLVVFVTKLILSRRALDLPRCPAQGTAGDACLYRGTGRNV